MHSIFVMTFITFIISLLPVKGFEQCTNPTDDGSRLTTDSVCLWFCSEMCTEPAQFGNQYHAGNQFPRPQFENFEQNFGQDHLTCHKRCVHGLERLVTCDQTEFKQSLTNACPNAQSLSVCLTSCGCCSTSPLTSLNCVQMCFRQGGIQNNNGQLNFPSQNFQNQAFHGQVQSFNGARPNLPGNPYQPGTQFGLGVQPGLNAFENQAQGFPNMGQGFQGQRPNGFDLQGNPNQFQPGSQFGAGSANGAHVVFEDQFKENVWESMNRNLEIPKKDTTGTNAVKTATKT